MTNEARSGSKASWSLCSRVKTQGKFSENARGRCRSTRATRERGKTQWNGYNLHQPPPRDPVIADARAEAFVVATRAKIIHEGHRAFYWPSTDSIHMPPRFVFIGTSTSSPTEAYYSTLFHELTHLPDATAAAIVSSGNASVNTPTRWKSSSPNWARHFSAPTYRSLRQEWLGESRSSVRPRPRTHRPMIFVPLPPRFPNTSGGRVGNKTPLLDSDANFKNAASMTAG